MPVLQPAFYFIIMKKLLLLALLFLPIGFISAIEVNADLFTYDEEKVAKAFEKLDQLEQIIMANPEASVQEIANMYPYFADQEQANVLTPYSLAEINAPGNFSSFWFTFTLSAVGFSFFPYGAIAAPVSVIIVYFSADRDKKETKKAIWGCVTGSLLGAGIKYAVVNL